MVQRKDKTKKEFDEILLEVRKVTRVTTGGRRMSFRATVLIWNKKWKIWLWLAKWADVSVAVKKATNEAYKHMFTVPITENKSVPYPTENKYKACRIRILPATQGTWLKAWSSVRSVLNLAWYENILSKIIWSNNKLNNAIATINALTQYKHFEHFVSFNKEKVDNLSSEAQKSNESKELDTKKTKITTKKDTKETEQIKKTIKKVEPSKKNEVRTTVKKPVTKKTTTKKIITKKDSK